MIIGFIVSVGFLVMVYFDIIWLYGYYCFLLSLLWFWFILIIVYIKYCYNCGIFSKKIENKFRLLKKNCWVFDYVNFKFRWEMLIDFNLWGLFDSC